MNLSSILLCTIINFELKTSEELKSAGLHLQIKIKALMLIIGFCLYGQILTRSL